MKISLPDWKGSTITYVNIWVIHLTNLQDREAFQNSLSSLSLKSLFYTLFICLFSFKHSTIKAITPLQNSFNIFIWHLYYRGIKNTFTETYIQIFKASHISFLLSYWESWNRMPFSLLKFSITAFSFLSVEKNKLSSFFPWARSCLSLFGPSWWIFDELSVKTWAEVPP